MPGANVFLILGWLTALLAGSMVLPVLAAAILGDPADLAFSAAAAVTLFVGGGIILALRGLSRDTSRTEFLLLGVLVWPVIAVFAAIPFAAHGFSLTDAWFEAISGFTTTGATILSDPAQIPRTLLVWRAALQWMGGLTTLVLAVGLLTPVGLGPAARMPTPIAPLGSQGGDGSLHDHILRIAAIILPAYGLLTLACIILTRIGGLPWFHAFCLSLSTVSTGGFSTVRGSLSVFAAPGAEAVILVFMVLGAISIACHAALLRGDLRPWRDTPEVRYFLAALLVGGLLLAAILHQGYGLIGNINRDSALFGGFFSAASLLSTTGFLSGDAAVVFVMPPVIVIVMIVIGGSTLSTAGGIKLIRIVLLMKQGKRELTRLAHPSTILSTRIAGRMVGIEQITAVWAFFAAFVIFLAVMAAALAATGIDFLTAITAAAAALSNAGPALDYVRPPFTGSAYGTMPDTAKWILSAGMIAGRVEILVLLALFNLAYWPAYRR